MKKLFTAAMFSFLALNANAQEATEPTDTKPVIAPSPELVSLFTKICAADFVLSDKAQLACINKETPKPNKAQTMFRNTGIGAEFNTLARQMKG